MRRFHIYIGFIVWLLTSLFAVSCNDELEGDGYSFNSSSNLHVLVPTVLSANGDATRGSSSEVPTYNATVDECQINDLRLYAFPVNNNGKLVAENLPAPLASMMLEPNVANYQLTIEPGTYHIYVVANMSDVLKAQDQKINSEEKLKNIVLNYFPLGAQPGMPVSTNIPMIYEPKDINGKTTETEIKATDKSATVIANLKFTCVKVKLNLIFDPDEAKVFSGKSFSIKNILAQQLTPKTSLCWDGKFSQSKVSKEYAEGFESNQYDAANNKNGLYYQGDAWERNDANANINDKDVITLNEGAKGSDNPTNATPKWLFQGTYYLPERYIADASQQSRLAIEGSIDGNIDNKYIIPLGHKQDESTELPTFPRGTYYEIIGNIKSLGNITLDGKTFIKPWEPMSIDADFSHTTLWLDKTKAKLTSLTNDSIFYKTNAADVEFGCDKKISVDGKDKDFIIAAKKYNDRIIFTINPAIPYTAYSATEKEGKAKIWVKANNLIKYLDVEYNIQPLFEVDPLETTIFYEAGAETNTKKFTWVTNLGGIVIDKYKSTVGSSNITIKLENSDTDAKGTISVKAENNPTTTVEHYFKAYSKEPVDGKYIERTIKVVVKPPFGDYYIYFRAINDRKYNDAKYEGTLDENVDVSGDNYNYNWNDGWLQDKGSNAINVNHHNLYMYYQYGESNGTDNIPEENVWYFTGYYTTPGVNGPAERNSRMTGAANNPGWYYYKIPKDAKGHNNHNKADREIKPGETLMIFYSYNNDGPEYHRCPHHMEPGIPLFNYEDHDGWILYDPTSDPTYRIFDERPEVENVTYTVYSPYEIKRWSCNFGISNNELTGQWTLYDEVGSRTESNGSMTFSEKTIGGKKWYVTKIKLKAVKGYHEKTILIQNNSGDTNESKVLFGGRSYEKNGDTGWIERKGGGIVAWHPGVPESGDWTDDNGNKQ